MHASLFNGMVDVLEEIWTKQQDPKEDSEAPSSLLPLQHQGNWEVIYLGDNRNSDSNDEAGEEDKKRATAGGKAFRYPGYTRSRIKEGCDTTKG